MAQLQKIIKVTQEQYNTLNNGGTVGDYTGIDPSFIYLVEDNNEEGGVGLKEISYENLKSLRDNSKLVPGKQYRITDYVTTIPVGHTIYYGVQCSSALHQFDIIVTADTKNTLNEVARVTKHDDDDYFAYNNLAAWEIKYSLDNDLDRFDWADRNGKGVIYWMKDDLNNECPYDFKNILFGGDYTFSVSSIGTLPYGYREPTFGASFEDDPYYEASDDPYYDPYSNPSDDPYSNPTFRYEDASLNPNYFVYNNIIKECRNSDSTTLTLPGNLFYGEYIYENILEHGCYSNKFGTYCHNNEFGFSCYNNILWYSSYHNTFGPSCYNNNLGQDNSYNTFKAYCINNTFEYLCSNNTFGYDCSYNTFEDWCCNNTFDRNCWYNNLGHNSDNNTFDMNCWRHNLGSYCRHNTFGNGCQYNTFEHRIENTQLGNDCTYIDILGFGADSLESEYSAYFRHNKIENGCKYLTLTYTGPIPNDSSYAVQYNVIHSGISGSSRANRKTISLSTVDNEYTVDYYASGSKEVILND